MLVYLDEISEKIQELIKEQAELENKKTGYNMELEQMVSRSDHCIFYHQSKKIDYEDYIVEIRNQGDYEPENDEWNRKGFYAYEIVISSKQQKEPQLTYQLSSMVLELVLYDNLPSWEILKSFFESEEVKQLFTRYNKAYDLHGTMIQAELKGDEDEEL